MPRYNTEEEEVEVRPSTAIVGFASVISAVLISTGLIGALIWLNIFIWSKVF
jgi:hypothetical protein